MTQNQAEHLLQPGVHIDDSSKVFVVEILKSKNVSILKDLMKEKRSHRLNHVAASELILSQVSLPVDNDLEKSLKNVDLTPLMPFLQLSQSPVSKRIACTSSFKHKRMFNCITSSICTMRMAPRHSYVYQARARRTSKMWWGGVQQRLSESWTRDVAMGT